MLQQLNKYFVNKLVKKNTIYYLYVSTASLNFVNQPCFYPKSCIRTIADENSHIHLDENNTSSKSSMLE